MLLGRQRALIAPRDQFLIAALEIGGNRLIDLQQQLGFGGGRRRRFLPRAQGRRLLDELRKFPARHLARGVEQMLGR